MPQPLTLTLTVKEEHPGTTSAQPTTRLDLQLTVQHGPWQTQVHEVMEASASVPLFDVVVDRLKEEVRRVWINDQSR